MPRALLDALLAEFKIRQRQRQQWDERRADTVYRKRMKEDQRPIARPQFRDRKDRLPKSLTTAIQTLASVKVSKKIPMVRKTKEKHCNARAQEAQIYSAGKKKRPSNVIRKKEGRKRKREN